MQGGLRHWRDTPSQEEKPRRVHVNEWACVSGMAGWVFERKPEALEEAPRTGQNECGTDQESPEQRLAEILKPWP